jgi:hypothetical protein
MARYSVTKGCARNDSVSCNHASCLSTFGKALRRAHASNRLQDYYINPAEKFGERLKKVELETGYLSPSTQRSARAENRISLNFKHGTKYTHSVEKVNCVIEFTYSTLLETKFVIFVRTKTGISRI